MNLSLLAGAILNGLVTGMLYALMGIGLSLILGLLNIPNFAHGVLYALGAYVMVSGTKAFGFVGGALAALVAVAVLGAVIETLGVRRLSRVHPDYTLLLTFGLSLILTESIILVWGPVGITSQPPALLAGSVDLGVTLYPKYRLVVMVVTAVLVLASYLFVTRTRYGAIIRAGIEDKDMAAALGINIRRVFTVTFAAGAGLAALGGALMTPVRGLLPTMGLDILPFAFVVVVLGGLGSLPGAILAGLLVGVVQSLMTAIWPPGADASVFVLMTLGIIARPQGLLGQR
ncbi:MAG: branched-chain amino acid ABC transporter permease [Candidatus Rokuibacteriota bacterium]|nr:MAG: branched-chain amino acid ABC transporter permease [Candidatus Rokubacteria bacterium]